MEKEVLKTAHATTAFPRHEHDHWAPFMRDLCEAIASRGVDVDIFAPNAPDTEPMDLEATLHRFDYFVPCRFQQLSMPPGIMSNVKNRPWMAAQVPPFYLSMAHSIKKAAKTADLVHAHWLIPCGFAAVRNTDKPVIASALGAEWHLNPDGVLAKMVRYTQDRADVITTMSEYMKQRGIEQFGCDPDKIRIMQNAANTETFQPNIDTAIRDEYGIPEDHPVVTTVRRFTSEKRVADVVAAAEQVLAEHEDVTFILVGDGPEREQLEEQVESAGVAENVVFTGYVPHQRLPEVMAASDIYVMTSAQEGMSTALLEAMAGGAVPVATDGVGNDEVVNSGEHGFLFATGDIAALADNVSRLLSRPEELERMSRAARQRIEDKFSYDVVAEKYVSLYEEVLE